MTAWRDARPDRSWLVRGKLSAVEAASAIAEGWSRQAPRDELAIGAVCDAGVGFVDVLHESLGGELLAVAGVDAFGVPAPGIVLVVGDTAYVEAAQLAGGGLSSAGAEQASSRGVGRLVAEALATDVERVVVGVGARGVVCNDGGAGLLAALGATSEPVDALTWGTAGLDSVVSVDLTPVRELIGSKRLVLATDDEVPLLGLLGTTNAAGLARGLAAERIPTIDAKLERLADIVGRKAALLPSAGAGGGIGYALLLAGASIEPGLRTVMEGIGLARRVAEADLVVTGEEAFDLSAGSGLIATGVAMLAGSLATPCIALAIRVAVGARETRALGIESAYAVPDPIAADAGPAAHSPADRLAALAQRVARTWSWSR